MKRRQFLEYETMKQALSKTEESTAVREDIARSWYRKSHNYYEPSEQITRDYKKPFDKSATFGKPQRYHRSEARIKRLFTWINHESATLVNCQQADFIERTRSYVGKVKDPKMSRFYADIVHGKKSIEDEFDASDALYDSDLAEEILFWWRCLQDLSNFRRKLKNRVPEVPFLDIEDELSCLDKKCVGFQPEDKVFAIIKKHRICPNMEFLMPLMDTLQLRKDGNINYRELLNLLNWRRNLPILPKTKQASLASSDYVTTYADSIGNIRILDNAKIRAAGLPSERSGLFGTVPHASTCPDKKNPDD